MRELADQLSVLFAGAGVLAAGAGLAIGWANSAFRGKADKERAALAELRRTHGL